MSLVIVPSVDLRGGQVVRLKQGDYARQVTYAVDPLDVARSYAAAGAQWMHIVDLDGAKEGRPVQTDLITKMIAASGLKVQVGGGIRGTDDVQRLLDAGASRVVVGTHAMENWPWFQQLVQAPAYDQKIVLALDAKSGVVATRGWTHASGKLAVDVAAEVSDSPWPPSSTPTSPRTACCKAPTSSIPSASPKPAKSPSSPAAASATSSTSSS